MPALRAKAPDSTALRGRSLPFRKTYSHYRGSAATL